MDAQGAERQRILVVDDDARLRDLLGRYLIREGFDVEAVSIAGDLGRVLGGSAFHLVILDWMLPGVDGLSALGKLRMSQDETPVILLTARGDEADRVAGLEMGADDYLAKPFSPRELLARIRAVLRRKASASGARRSQEDDRLPFGTFVLDMVRRTLSRDNVDMSITTSEWNLLAALARNPNRPLTRDRLMEITRGRDCDPLDRAIDVQISRLRKIIEKDPSAPRFIKTVWGYGYRFDPQGDRVDVEA